MDTDQFSAFEILLIDTLLGSQQLWRFPNGYGVSLLHERKSRVLLVKFCGVGWDFTNVPVEEYEDCSLLPIVLGRARDYV